jgi:phosphoglycerol transferase MdoB-like AlkP superfamily enzyme
LKKKKKNSTSFYNHLPIWIAGLYAGFLGIFALDVFGEYQGLELLIALTMHLIPTILVITSLLITISRRQFGAWLFILFSLFTLLFFKTYQDPITLIIITLPPALTGILLLTLPKKM